MSKITVLVQTEGSHMKDILINGGYMLLCALGSLILSIGVGFIIANLSSNFSLKIRSKLFNKVESFGIAEIKKFQTSSLITRRDVIELLRISSNQAGYLLRKLVADGRLILIDTRKKAHYILPGKN